MPKTPITVAYGDGIGPEIMEACLFILQEAGAELDIQPISIGEQVYRQGNQAGIPPEAWESIFGTHVLYKAPLTTPLGKGLKSVNVTLRKTLGLYANVRPVVTYKPFIESPHPDIDMVIVRENEEDLYAGIEHRQTEEVFQTLKLVSRPGTERIVRYAFEYARRYKRQKVICFTKNNIMKLTDGLFAQVFEEVGIEYPDIEREHMIIDIGAARIAAQPHIFDVVVTPNLYGDIISDIAAQVAGSVGLAGSANIGPNTSMFEAVHGSAPDIAGKDIANPSGLLMAGSIMLRHIGQGEVSARLRNAWRVTIEEGIHTPDVHRKGISSRLVGTHEFAREVVKRLGRVPQTLPAVTYEPSEDVAITTSVTHLPAVRKDIVGVDVFLDWDTDGRDPEKLGEALREVTVDGLALTMITNRGQKVWPEGNADTFLTDHWRCRYMAPKGEIAKHSQIVALLSALSQAGFDFIKTENLCTFDGMPGYSLGQGE